MGPSRWRWMLSPIDSGVAQAAFGILEVEAGREGLGRAGQDHDRSFEIVLEVARDVAQLAHRLVAEGIDVVAAIEAHDGDAALRAQALLDLDECAAPCARSSCVRAQGSASALQARAAWLDWPSCRNRSPPCRPRTPHRCAVRPLHQARLAGRRRRRDARRRRSRSARAMAWPASSTACRSRPQTRFRIASVSKQFTVTAALMLAAEGKLKLSDPPHKYLTRAEAAARHHRPDDAQLAAACPISSSCCGWAATASTSRRAPAELLRRRGAQRPSQLRAGQPLPLQQHQLPAARASSSSA